MVNGSETVAAQMTQSRTAMGDGKCRVSEAEIISSQPLNRPEQFGVDLGLKQPRAGMALAGVETGEGWRPCWQLKLSLQLVVWNNGARVQRRGQVGWPGVSVSCG
jgi:hypothetical protein